MSYENRKIKRGRVVVILSLGGVVVVILSLGRVVVVILSLGTVVIVLIYVRYKINIPTIASYIE